MQKSKKKMTRVWLIIVFAISINACKRCENCKIISKYDERTEVAAIQQLCDKKKNREIWKSNLEKEIQRLNPDNRLECTTKN
jgi:hypothetical protein